jgi:hypothetical protein
MSMSVLVNGDNEQVLINGGCVGCVVGAEALAEQPGIWVKTHFYRDGNFLCATVYSVAAGEPKVVELRVDLRPIARAVLRAHSALHAREATHAAVRGQPLVGWSLKKMWKGVKKVAQKVGRLKLVKGVVGVTKAIGHGVKVVAKSKVFGAVLAVASVFPLTAPFAAPALGAYVAANAAVKGVELGSKVVKVAASAASTISRAAHLTKSVKAATSATSSLVKNAGATMAPALRASLASRASAAGKLTLNTQGKATVAAALARAPAGAARAKVASQLASRLKTLATVRSRTVLAKNLPAKASAALVATTKLQLGAAPIIAKAAATQKQLQDPKVQAKLVALRNQGTKSAAALASVKAAAATGDLDAQKSAAIIDLVARNRARIQAMSQANAGGLPGILISPQGKLVRGRFRVQAKAGTTGLLYTGPGKPSDHGSYTTVSGIDGRCFAVNGDLPLDGVRFSGAGANAHEIGPYEVEGDPSLIGCNCSVSGSNAALPA